MTALIDVSFIYGHCDKQRSKSVCHAGRDRPAAKTMLLDLGICILFLRVFELASKSSFENAFIYIYSACVCTYIHEHERMCHACATSVFEILV